ncbi:MAG TPA: hypothetical protein VNT55_06810 [Baekduia sp.]|nr:hypothetical protein [Baekduia sp.]
MADPERSLVVWCFGAIAGTLTDAPGGPAFAYADRWLADGMPPLSQ